MRRRERLWLMGALCLWFLLNLLFLTRYPYMHSDESWLAGLSRSMLSNHSIGVTESFFDLKPRYPHAIKLIFQLLLMPFMALFGHTLFAIRLPSLLAGAAALFVCYRIARQWLPASWALGMMALMGLNNQFIAISHTARQEIYLLVLLLVCLWLLTARKPSVKRSLWLGLTTGLAVGFHPNSFLLAVAVGLTLCGEALMQKRLPMKELLAYVGVTALLAGVFVGISFAVDPQFPMHYRMYGENEFNLFEPTSNRMAELFPYLAKLWTRTSATYDVPELRLNMVLAVAFLLGNTWQLLAHKQQRALPFVLLPLGVLAGTVLIGRYNQLSAALWLLPALLGLIPLCAAWLHKHETASASLAAKWTHRAFLPMLLAATLAVSASGIAPWLDQSYEAYLHELSAYVSPTQKTLGNLNTALYFEEDAFWDVRNLSYLKEKGMSFEEYIEKNQIEMILWSDEMAYVYAHRPTWNILYGNPRYVPEAEAFFQAHCKAVGKIWSDTFAVRLCPEMGKPYCVTVYKVIRR
ncbi:MAG: glycosyltransferase family 39 protein [Clostridia bacterium]